MTRAKFKGRKRRFEIMINYYYRYYEYFIATTNLTSTDTSFYSDEYWEHYRNDVLKYLFGIAGTENTWSSNLFEIVENESGRYSKNEVERYMYWFLVHTYRIDGDTNLKELKRRFRKEYKKCVKSKK